MCSQINKFNTLLAEIRCSRGLSANRLSKLSGVNRKTILDIEAGAVPNLQTVEKLCKALEITFVINE